VFPLRDDVPSRRAPVVTIVLILINAVVFVREVVAGPDAARVLHTFGLVPGRELSTLVRTPWMVGEWLPPFVTSMFLHAGWAHVIGNLWFLGVFGDNVEDRLGRLRYLGFYLLAGLVAAVAQVVTNPLSPIPMVGASGAVAGVLGAYLVLHPRAQILTFLPIFIIPYFFRVPAPIFLGLWFVQQLWMGSMSLASAQAVESVAWWAHAGGFVFGMMVGVQVRRTRRRPADHLRTAS
jgi:hypothetical protein